MPHYRQNRVHGGTYFFTVNLRERKSAVRVTHINELRDAISKVLTRHTFHIDA